MPIETFSLALSLSLPTFCLHQDGDACIDEMMDEPWKPCHAPASRRRRRRRRRNRCCRSFLSSSSRYTYNRFRTIAFEIVFSSSQADNYFQHFFGFIYIFFGDIFVKFISIFHHAKRSTSRSQIDYHQIFNLSLLIIIFKISIK